MQTQLRSFILCSALVSPAFWEGDSGEEIITYAIQHGMKLRWKNQ